MPTRVSALATDGPWRINRCQILRCNSFAFLIAFSSISESDGGNNLSEFLYTSDAMCRAAAPPRTGDQSIHVAGVALIHDSRWAIRLPTSSCSQGLGPPARRAQRWTATLSMDGTGCSGRVMDTWNKAIGKRAASIVTTCSPCCALVGWHTSAPGSRPAVRCVAAGLLRHRVSRSATTAGGRLHPAPRGARPARWPCHPTNLLVRLAARPNTPSGPALLPLTTPTPGAICCTASSLPVSLHGHVGLPA